MKLGNDMIAPRLKKMQEEKFLQGMQRAASGEAYADIVNDQPWYTRIYGEGAVVEGAQAYEVQSKVEKWAGAHEANMGALRTQSPDQIPGYLMKSMDSVMTGDPSIDTLIRGNLTRVLPQLMKVHTKEHFKYQQENMVTQQAAAINAAADNVQIARTSTTDVHTAEALEQREVALLATATPPDGQDPTAYLKNVKAVIVEQAQKGNFHAVNVFRRGGVLGAMKPEDRVQLEAQIDAYSSYHRQKGMTGDWLIRAEQLKAQALAQGAEAVSPAVYRANVGALNADYTRATGNPDPLVTPPAEAHIVGTALAHQYAAQFQEGQRALTAQRVAATADAKAAAKAMLVNNIALAAARGDMTLVATTHAATEAEQDEGFMQAFNTFAPKDGALMSNEQVRLLVNSAQGQGGYVNKMLKARLTAGLEAPAELPTPQFQQQYAQWQALYLQKDGAAARMKYYTPDVDARMLSFHQGMQGQTIDAAPFVYQQTMLSQGKRVSLDKTEWKSIRGAIDDATGVNAPYLRDLFPGKLGNKPLKESAINELARFAGPTLERYKAAGLKPEELAEAMVHSALANGAETAAGYAWVNPKGTKPLRELLGKQGVSPDVVAHLFEQVLETKTKEANLATTPTVHAVIRMDDENGAAQFNVVYADGGRFKSFNVNSDQMRAAYVDPIRAAKEAEAAAIKEDEASRGWRVGKELAPLYSKQPTGYYEAPAQAARQRIRFQERISSLEADLARTRAANADTRGIEQALAQARKDLAAVK
jgi:hypothetical protein